MGFAKTAIFEAVNVGSQYLSYKDSREQGHGVGYSVGKAALEYAFYEMLSGPMALAFLAKDVGLAALEVTNAIGRENTRISSKAYKSNFGGSFHSSQNAATMRQRGIQAIQNNGLNARSVLGSEARSYFRSQY
jgi:hypothetical protein